MFLGLKTLKFFDEGPDPGSGTYLTLDPGWKKKHPGSATLPPNPYNTPNVTSARMAVTPLEKREFRKINLRMNGGLLEIVLLE